MAEPGREDQRARPRPPHRPTGADGQPPLLSAHYPEPTAAGAALLSRTSCPIRRPLINVTYLVLRVVSQSRELKAQPLGSGEPYAGRPTRRIRFWKRGSKRRLSSLGSTLRKARQPTSSPRRMSSR